MTSRSLPCLAPLASLVAAMLLASPAGSETIHKDAVRRQVERQVAGRGRPVNVESAASEVRVSAGSGDQVQVTAALEFWSNDKEYMTRVQERFDVELAEASDGIRIRAKLPDRPAAGGLRRLLGDIEVSYSIALNLTVPRGTPLKVSNSFGDVAIQGVGGPVQAHNQSGKISLEGAKGSVSLEGSFGDISARSIEGDLNASSTSGAIAASGVSGAANLASSYGDVQVEDVRGRLAVATTSGSVTVTRVGPSTLATSYGDVTAESVGGDLTIAVTSGHSRVTDVAGRLKLESSYGDVAVERLGGSAEIATTSGGVTAIDLRGDLVVRCSFGSVRARNIGGGMRVTASSTPVEAEMIGGPVNVETTFGGVRLTDVRGAVTVQDQSGSVTVQGLSGAALEAQHHVETSFGDIDFHWPKGRAVSYKLEGTFGWIQSDLPGNVREISSRRILEGRQGAGGASLSLVTQSGNIDLKSQ